MDQFNIWKKKSLLLPGYLKHFYLQWLWWNLLEKRGPIYCLLQNLQIGAWSHKFYSRSWRRECNRARVSFPPHQEANQEVGSGPRLHGSPACGPDTALWGQGGSATASRHQGTAATAWRGGHLMLLPSGTAGKRYQSLHKWRRFEKFPEVKYRAFHQREILCGQKYGQRAQSNRTQAWEDFRGCRAKSRRPCTAWLLSLYLCILWHNLPAKKN